MSRFLRTPKFRTLALVDRLLHLGWGQFAAVLAVSDREHGHTILHHAQATLKREAWLDYQCDIDHFHGGGHFRYLTRGGSRVIICLPVLRARHPPSRAVAKPLVKDMISDQLLCAEQLCDPAEDRKFPYGGEGTVKS